MICRVGITSSATIPNRICTLFNLSTKDEPKEEFKFWHYICLRSMYIVNRPKDLVILGSSAPTGNWWELAKTFVRFEHVEPIVQIYGHHLIRRTDRADVMRLQWLIENGGIYLDSDTICVKPLTNLLHCRAVMGHEFKNGLCNAVILSVRANPFLREWLSEFQNYRGQWDSHAVFAPWTVSQRPQNTQNITILPRTAFFDPFWDTRGIELMHKFDATFPYAYSHHLWNQMANKKLNSYDIDSVRKGTSTFCRLARMFI
jgi:hypothetical protein